MCGCQGGNPIGKVLVKRITQNLRLPQKLTPRLLVLRTGMTQKIYTIYKHVLVAEGNLSKTNPLHADCSMGSSFQSSNAHNPTPPLALNT